MAGLIRGTAVVVASGLGAGYAPAAPGTVGSVVAAIIGVPLLSWGHGPLAVAAVAAVLAGLWAIRLLRATDDPGWVVIDEFAGQWIAMLALPGVSPAGVLLALVLFRLLDIAKPGPIGWADRMGGAKGVMLDDVLAGAAAAGLILVLRLAVPELL